MRRPWRGIIMLVGLLLAIKPVHGQQVLLRVDEDHIHLHLLPSPKIDLPLVSAATEPVEGSFLLEMLDANGIAASSKQGAFQVSSGNTIVKVDWEEAHLPTRSPSQLGWYRLRYTLTPKAPSSFGSVRGVVQLGRLISDGFELRMAGAASVARGAKYPVRMRVDNPGTGHPYSGVPVKLTLTLDDDDDHALHRNVTTDASGYAVAVFELPNTPSVQKGEVSAIATRGALAEEQSVRFEFLRQPSLTITTDKPLYQPGQTLHTRLLAFGDDKEAWQGANVDLTIEDSEGQEAYRTQVTTSPFGVATADWEIPAKIRLDEYSIRAEIDLPNHDNVATGARVRINRYELPEFTVKVKPDRPYYLPGQSARIEVSADYLFGKPVHRANVRIVRQEERHWNVREQKWDAEESTPVEGELDSTGKFVGSFALKESFEDFEESRYRRFQDLTLAAYVTDLSSGRTEQRRFNLRLTYQPIHLYLTVESSLATDQPILLYLTSSYADGTPASVTGMIEAVRPNDFGEFDDNPNARRRSALGRFHTNRYGVARVELATLPENVLAARMTYECDRTVWQACQSATDRWTVRLLFHGADRVGLTGNYSEDTEVVRGLDYMRVRTERTLYHPGETIAGSIQSNTRAKEVIVGIASKGGLLDSQVVHLNRGQGSFSVPYDVRFRGQIDIIALTMTEVENRDRALWAAASVIYPSPQELRVTTRVAKTTFRPGENANVNVRVNLPEGKPTKSALGVLVFDRAVAERVRSDEEFGHGYEFSIFDYYWGYRSSIAGITYRDLLNLDANKPYSPDLDLLAELLIRADFSTYLAVSGGTADYANEAAQHFAVKEDPSIKAVEKTLDQIYKTSGEYPKAESDYRTMLKAAGIDPDSVRDPWDIPYRPVFSVFGAYDVLSLVSNGVDKRPNTADDFAAASFRRMYFIKIGEAINAALARYQRETGQYVRDYPALRRELAKQGVDLESLRDPWGTPYAYTFPISGPYFQVLVTSAGPDRRFDSEQHPSRDDVVEWTSYIHYFQQETADLNRALSEHFAATATFPQNEAELRPILQASDLTPARLLDPWGNSYHFSFNSQSRYWDRIDVRDYSTFQGQTQKKTEITPVTQKMAYILVTSYGPENKPEAAFSVAEFSRVVAEMSSADVRAMPTPKAPPRSKGTGGIIGTVTDPSGAVLAGASVVATNSDTGQQFSSKTDSAGSFAINDLPVGIYRLEFSSTGFRVATVVQVPVEEAGTTRVDTTLRVGAATETVEVQAAAPAVETTAAQVSVKSERQLGTQAGQNNQIFTPRLRKYFPETLLWRPEIVTDNRGNASFAFPMGDNITAWKMSIVASTKKGMVGVAEKDLRTFQPFFLVHDPPPVLTEGDRISLPVILRNYSEKSQTVATELQPQPWFSILSAPRQSITIQPNSDANAVFSLRAIATTKKGMQRVTARNTETGDAVERQISVHPDGQQMSFTTAKVLGASDDSLDFVLPESAIRGSAEAELRIYPNLIAHMLDALHGLAMRPGGCAEQITSSAYANLLILQALKKTGQDKLDPGNPHGALAVEARKNVQDGYLMLGQAQHADGSFSYWNLRDPDIALTAYVLRFLSRASEFIDVDQNMISRARRYLRLQQAKTGAWRSHDWKREDKVDDPILTAYVARALATTAESARDKDKEAKEMEESLMAAMNYVETQINSWNDAYLVGNYAIAAVASGKKERIAKAESSLAALVHREGPTSYWNLEANTSPLYGWGLAGRLETTALAVEALNTLRGQNSDADLTDVNRGVQFLLSHKDRYAMWYSSQATQNVMEALFAALPSSPEPSNGSDATVTLNGSNLSTIKLPPAQMLTGPIAIELDEHLTKGVNHLRILRSSDSSAMNIALLGSYYVPNSESTWTTQKSFNRGDERALQLRVLFDRTNLDLKDAITCQVEAERIGFHGYGMLVAEVGLPPAADVDRASLEAAKEAGSIDAYEVQPDKVLFYLWPTAGGTKFAFRFHSRMRMEAMSGPSLVYDYYNPDAAAAVSPSRFSVH